MSMHENTLCKAAFNDIFLDPNGYVQPCCFINENSNRLNIKDVDNLNDWFFNNKEITSLRENLSTNII